MNVRESPFLIRRLDKNAKSLKFAKSDGESDELIELVMDEIAPSKKDAGWSSFWEAKTEAQERHIKAGLLALRNKRKPDKLDWVKLPKEMASDIQIEYQIPTKAFDCIVGLHEVLYLDNEEIRENLASRIIRFLYENPDCCGRIKPSEVPDYVKDVYNSCLASDQEPDLSQADQWVREVL